MEQLPAKQSQTLSLSKAIKTGIKIRELKNDNPIREALVYAFVLVGLDKKNYPADIEKQVLIDFIIGAYGGLLAIEIKEAFKMAVAHKFQDVDVNCYQKFSPEYFGRIMASYYIWRQAQLANKSEGEYKEPKRSDEEYYLRKLIVPFENALTGQPFPFTNLDWIMYDNLYKLKVPIQPSDEERQAFLAEARNVTPKKKREKITEPEESDADYENRIKKVAKCMAFKSWIQEQMFNETHLRHIINVLLAK